MRLHEVLAANQSLMRVDGIICMEVAARLDAVDVTRKREPDPGSDVVRPTTTRLLARHRQPVRWPMHTGQLEGISNKIKMIKRMAYGYRDSDYFFLKIKAAFPVNPSTTFLMFGLETSL
jgi:hypothetical protein